MPITFLTNITAMFAQRMLEKNSKELGNSMERLVSGKQINRAADNPSGFAIANNLEASVRAVQQAQRNAMDAKSVVQVAEGSLNEINNLTLRLRELAIISASDVINPEARDAIQIEADETRAEIDRIANTTRYFNTNLLNGTGQDLRFQIGTDNSENSRITYSAGAIDARSESLGLNSIDLSDPDSALESLGQIDQALTTITTQRSRAGSFQTRLDSVINQHGNLAETLSGDISRVRDTDYAKETADYFKLQTQQQAGLAILTQANSSPMSLLKLLNPNG